MKKNLTALDLHYLMKELDILINGKVDQIYQFGKKEFLFQFYIRDKGKRLLRISLPNFIYLTDTKEASGKNYSYCQFLRKHLNNSILKDIRQTGFERILKLHFQSKENLILIIELFSKGNLILCKNNYEIMLPLEIQKWKSREIRKGLNYKFPELKIDLLELKESKFKKLLKDTEKNKIVTFLAIELSLGGEYSEKLCLDSGIDKDKKPTELENDEIKNLYREIIKLIGKEEKISEIIDKTPTEKKSGYDKEIEKIEEIIERQKEHIEGIKMEISENDKKADTIYNNYNLIKNIIDELNEISKKHSWHDIKKRLKNHKVIKEVSPKEKTIILEIR